MNPSLNVVDLAKRYGSVVAVDHVSLSVEPGEVFGILGPNGAGKTTLVEMIEGLRRPDHGEIHIQGLDARTQRREILEIIGVQLQSTSLYDRIRVREALLLFAGYYRSPVPVEGLLQTFSLEEKQRAYVHQLSGGQKQRLALALALVNDPKLVFLDEPTTGLDPQARRSMWEAILSLRDEGRTVVLTTHFMEEAETLCRRVAIMDHGKMIALDTPDALIADAGLESAVEVAVLKESLHQAIDSASWPARMERVGEKLVFHTTEPSRILSELTQLAAAEGVSLDELTVRKATLEDVFLSLTGRQLRE
ncbi:MAG TPA: ABC transporter ATP-binding protein [Candidatus Acetothermia bacterium]|nr:ABC transporter ATP-binding protein [Candidatus Acetothermia bacterium]